MHLLWLTNGMPMCIMSTYVYECVVYVCLILRENARFDHIHNIFVWSFINRKITISLTDSKNIVLLLNKWLPCLFLIFTIILNDISCLKYNVLVGIVKNCRFSKYLYIIITAASLKSRFLKILTGFIWITKSVADFFEMMLTILTMKIKLIVAATQNGSFFQSLSYLKLSYAFLNSNLS